MCYFCYTEESNWLLCCCESIKHDIYFCQVRKSYKFELKLIFLMLFFDEGYYMHNLVSFCNHNIKIILCSWTCSELWINPGCILFFSMFFERRIIVTSKKLNLVNLYIYSLILLFLLFLFTFTCSLISCRTCNNYWDDDLTFKLLLTCTSWTHMPDLNHTWADQCV